MSPRRHSSSGAPRPTLAPAAKRAAGGREARITSANESVDVKVDVSGGPGPLFNPDMRSRIFWGVGFGAVAVALLWVLRPVLAVLAASAGIAYILDPLVDWFEKRGLSRERGIVVVIGSMVLGLVLIVLILSPIFMRQFDSMYVQLSGTLSTLDQRLEPALAWISDKTGRELSLELGQLSNDALAWLSREWPQLQEKAIALVQGLFTQGLGVISAILNIALLPIFVYYLLRDWDRMVAAAGDLVPHRYRPRVVKVAGEVDLRLGAFIRGQITVCLILAVLYSVGLLLVGIDLAVPVGVLSGLLFIIPYLGTAVGIVLGVLLALVKFGAAWQVIGVLAVFVIVQLFEGSLLTPKIMGDQVGLHPVVVMIALIVGGSIMGIWGMLVAIPVTAVLSTVAAEWISSYRQSELFGAET